MVSGRVALSKGGGCEGLNFGFGCWWLFNDEDGGWTLVTWLRFLQLDGGGYSTVRIGTAIKVCKGRHRVEVFWEFCDSLGGGWQSVYRETSTKHQIETRLMITFPFVKTPSPCGPLVNVSLV